MEQQRQAGRGVKAEAITDQMKLTYEDYCRLPNDGRRHEIIDGAHYNHAAPRTTHQLVSRNLERLVEPFIREHRLGVWLSAPTDVVFGPHDVVQPDKVFISRDRREIVTELNIQGVPDLVVEITSPEDPGYDRETKLHLYARYQVSHYWIVDAQLEAMEIYRHVGVGYDLVGRYRRGDTFAAEPFSTLTLAVDEVFDYE